MFQFRNPDLLQLISLRFIVFRLYLYVCLSRIPNEWRVYYKFIINLNNSSNLFI